MFFLSKQHLILMKDQRFVPLAHPNHFFFFHSCNVVKSLELKSPSYEITIAMYAHKIIHLQEEQ